MSKMKNEISKKNPYFVPKHRMLELKHFCLQYPEWKKEYNRVNQLYLQGNSNLDKIYARTNKHNDSTAELAIKKIKYQEMMNLVENAANKADPELSNYILISVTEGISFDALNAKMRIPCCRDTFYDRWRKFFWLLSKER